ncbi:cell wall-binding repeat-containing protein [Leifsonia sp. RAF41]|uniref:cell wall-binding repeat-containing protein n=1 Tax=Leifsonia sp. RAF41 TaxID=3233056 RepID=UPI003F96D49D
MFSRSKTMTAAAATAAIAMGALVLSGATAASADGWTTYQRTVPFDGYAAVTAFAVDPVTQTAYGIGFSASGPGADAIVSIDAATGATDTFYQLPPTGYVMDVQVDSDQRLLYIVSTSDDFSAGRVTVVDLDTAATVATIVDPSLTDAMTMTIDPQTHDGYVLNGGSDTGSSPIAIIDGTTHTVKGTITDPSLVNSASLTVNPVNHLLYVTNDGDPSHPQANVAVIDTVNRTVVKTITSGVTWPYRVAADPSTGRVYVANQPDYVELPDGSYSTTPSSILEVDGSTNTVTRTIASPILQQATGLAVDAATNTLLITGGGDYLPGQPALVSVDLASGVVDTAGSFPAELSTFDVVVEANSRTVWTLNGVFDGTPSVSILGLTAKPTTTRIAAPDRFSNAVEIAKAAYPTTAPVVYIATGLNYPDALGAGAAAAHEGGPLLLTTPTELPASVTTEIQSLKPDTIVVVGGPNSVSDSVLAQLHDLAQTVTRQGGADRYEASRNIVAGAFDHSTTAFIATGSTFPDALSATSAAASKGAPVVLVNGAASALDAKTLALLQTLGVTDVTITGGPASVSPAIESQLKAVYGSGHVMRLGGADRFDASATINEQFFHTATHAYLATGSTFPDALAGGVLAATKSAPLLVVRGDCVPTPAVGALQAWGVSGVTLIGGTASLSPALGTLHPCS